jgi:hypothetical protein
VLRALAVLPLEGLFFQREENSQARDPKMLQKVSFLCVSFLPLRDFSSFLPLRIFRFMRISSGKRTLRLVSILLIQQHHEK